MPPEAPLALPRNPLHQDAVPLRGRPGGALRLWSARALVVLLTALLTAYGVREMHGVISATDVTPLQQVFLTLFAVNFAWVAFACVQALLGFFAMLLSAVRRRAPDDSPPLRTALLLPICNEAAAPALGGALAMARALAAAAPGRMAVFVLSDTQDPDAWIAEEAVVAQAIREAPEACPIHYRHRPRNVERKAGNIADWVRRFGGAWDAFVVLDADSLMEVQTLLELSRRLRAEPGLGLIQTVPRIIRGHTLYARLQQFANHCYGPLYAQGLALWHGHSGCFWGHNAIIRTRAFAAAAHLPLLSGAPPFGGHVLSHDFAEAACLRRAGWGVRLDADLGGSYEEAPPTLLDVMQRDRRWCQGNFQHLRLLFARGFSPVSRMHFVTGIMAYLSASFWFLLVLTGLALALQAQTTRPEYFTEPALFPRWPVFDAARAIDLFVLSMGVVLGPKLLGWLAALLLPGARRGFGGPLLLTASLLWETLLSALYAPRLMLAQCRIVVAVLLGRDAGWRPQRRRDGTLPLRTHLRAHAAATLTGAGLAVLSFWIDPRFGLWLLPLTTGLLLAVPLSLASGDGWLAWLSRVLRLGTTPQARQPTPLMVDAAHRSAALAAVAADGRPALLRLATDDSLRRWHLAQLPMTAPEALPEDNLLLACAKAAQQPDPARLSGWLSPAETRALLSSPQLRRLFPAAALTLQAPAPCRGHPTDRPADPAPWQPDAIDGDTRSQRPPGATGSRLWLAHGPTP